MNIEAQSSEWSLLTEALAQIARLERAVAELLLKNERLRQQADKSAVNR